MLNGEMMYFNIIAIYHFYNLSFLKLNMNARNHAQNDDLKKMITYYMLDNDKISDSLYEG